MDTQTIIRYAVSIWEQYLEDSEINLTAVEEDVRDHFELSDTQFEDGDISFLIFKAFDKRGLL